MGRAETFFVVSSDLSHFHDHDTAARVDAETSRLIESLRFEDLSGERCCGFKAIGGLLQAARIAGLRVRSSICGIRATRPAPATASSGTVPLSSKSAEDELTGAEHRRTLLDVAAKSIDVRSRHGA